MEEGGQPWQKRTPASQRLAAGGGGGWGGEGGKRENLA